MEFKECERCPGYCCMSSDTLQTPLTSDDITRIARHLRIPVERFIQNFVTLTKGRIFFREVPTAIAYLKTHSACPFLRQGLCGINAVKPQACQEEVVMQEDVRLHLTCALWHKARIGWMPLIPESKEEPKVAKVKVVEIKAPPARASIS